MILSNLASRGTLKGTIYRGGGGGVTDYNALSGKPQINGTTVEGDHDGGYYGLIDSADIEVTEIYEIGFGSNYDINLNGSSVNVTNQRFHGATNSANGSKGLVPAPAAGSVGKILSNEGWIDPPSSVVNYSTSEQKTGQKWIDGKDIYFMTVEGTGSFNTSDYFGSYSGSVSVPFSFDNIWFDRNMSYLILSSGVKEGFIFMQNSNGTIILFTCASRSSVDYKLVFYYTK